MIKELSSRTTADGRVVLGTKKSRLLLSMLHWTQDFARISQKPSIVGLNQATFLDQLDRAMQRADYRHRASEQLSTRAKESDPGPLLSEKDWKDWEQKFINYAGCYFGSAGVPLSYVIQEQRYLMKIGVVTRHGIDILHWHVNTTMHGVAITPLPWMKCRYKKIKFVICDCWFRMVGKSKFYIYIYPSLHSGPSK
jgi:hypothetical protein